MCVCVCVCVCVCTNQIFLNVLGKDQLGNVLVNYVKRFYENGKVYEVRGGKRKYNCEGYYREFCVVFLSV